MILGLDIGRQFVKAVFIEQTRGGTKVLNAGIRLVPEQHKAYDPELIGKPMWVMAIRELMREMKINPKRVKNLVTGLNGTNVSVKQITTMDMPEDELFSSMTFEARKHIPMDGTDAVIDFQVFGPNPKEVDKIDVGLVACTKKVSNAHIELLKDVGLTPYIDFVVTSSEVLVEKPHPDIFLKAAIQMKLKPTECVVIEDALKGLYAAQNAGMYCVIVPQCSDTLKVVVKTPTTSFK